MGFGMLPANLADVVTALWGMERTGENLFNRPEFIQLRDYCLSTYDNAGATLWLNFALNNMLQSLGMPVGLPVSKLDRALPVEDAANEIHQAFTVSSVRLVHLCPLDLLESPPPISFGNNTMRRFTADELKALADAPRLERAFPNIDVDWGRLSRFHWLVIEEQIQTDKEPGERAVPQMYQALARDIGAFRPHEGRFPPAVENALFVLLLAPWEEWAESIEVDWRGFRVPWIYTSNRDLFVRLQSPPTDGALTWEPVAYTNVYGEEVDDEQPAYYRLAEEVSSLPKFINQSLWESWLKARGSRLFDTPVAHFLVRGFLADGIDEFLAHLMAIEASLGLKSDYERRSKGAPHNSVRPTERMVRRIVGVLRDESAGEEYRRLFNVRSEYIHGRPMAEISSADQAQARSLARRIVRRLIEIGSGNAIPSDRDGYLMALLD